MPSSPAERDEYAEYFCGSGAITCRVLYRTEQLVFVVFRTVDWPGYRDFSNYARVALFPEHLRPADPKSEGVRNWVQVIAREVAAQQQHLANYRHQANAQHAKEAVEHRVPRPEKPTEKLRVTQGNGVKPHPSKIKVKEASARSPARTRQISNLTLRDFGF